MKFAETKYNTITIVSVDGVSVDFLTLSLDMIYNFSKEMRGYLEHVETIIVGDYQNGDAIAASFVEEKTIVLTPYNTENIKFIASVLIHELTHLYHHQTNPKEYLNQEKAEKFAFKNEIDFLEKSGEIELTMKSKQIRDNLLKFLEQRKTTDNASSTELKQEDMDMSKHQMIVNNYFKQST